MASNLPSNLQKHTAFRDKPYVHTIAFPDGYPMPDEITGEVRRNRIVVTDVAPEITKTGQSFTFTYSPQQLAKIQGLSDQYFLFDGKQMLGGSLNVLIGYGEPGATTTSVVIQEGNVTTVQVDGVEVVSGLVAQVQQAAAVVASDKQDVAADRVVIEGIRDEVVGVAARKLDNWQVDTFADAQALSATLPGSAFIEVVADETQGGVRALYFWNTVELQEPLLL